MTNKVLWFSFVFRSHQSQLMQLKQFRIWQNGRSKKTLLNFYSSDPLRDASVCPLMVKRMYSLTSNQHHIYMEKQLIWHQMCYQTPIRILDVISQTGRYSSHTFLTIVINIIYPSLKFCSSVSVNNQHKVDSEKKSPRLLQINNTSLILPPLLVSFFSFFPCWCWCPLPLVWWPPAALSHIQCIPQAPFFFISLSHNTANDAEAKKKGFASPFKLIDRHKSAAVDRGELVLVFEQEKEMPSEKQDTV